MLSAVFQASDVNAQRVDERAVYHDDGNGCAGQGSKTAKQTRGVVPGIESRRAVDAEIYVVAESLFPWRVSTEI
jgi:hypothetical protein